MTAHTTPAGASLSRRSFVAGAAGAACLGAAGIAAPAARADEGVVPAEPQFSVTDGQPSFLAAPEPIDPAAITQVLDADVVVVGLGVAGVSAVRSAAEAGLSVVAIEVSEAPNGRSSQFSCFNSENARAMGIADLDAAEVVNELQVQMGHRADSRVLKNWADHCGEAFDWYAGAVDDIVWVHPGEEQPTDENQIFVTNGNSYEPFDPYRDHEKIWAATLSFRPNGHTPVMMANWEKALATGNVTPVFNYRGLQLTKDDDGRVNGVVAQSVEHKDEYLQANGARGVVLATGGYLHNDAMLAYYLPWIYNNKEKYSFTYMSVDLDVERTDRGDGHLMGYWAGGRIEDGPHAAMAHGDLGKLGVDAFLQLNALGERYVNEDLTNDHFGSQLVRQPDSTIYQLFDANWAEQLPAMQAGLGTQHVARPDMAETIDEWTTAKGDTLEELVDALGVDDEVAATMLAEIARYNELAAAGKDEDFGKAPERLFGLVTPPFYAIRYSVSEYEEGQNQLRCLVSMSGLSTNRRAQVLDETFRPVGGLYAIGNVQGGRFLGDYPTTIAGMSHSMAMTYGYLVGHYIAENA